jgi:uncharacterized protein YcnI
LFDYLSRFAVFTWEGRMGNRSTARHAFGRHGFGRFGFGRFGFGGRAALAAVAMGTVIAAFPAAAWAHAEFEGNPSVPANSDQKLTLNVPEEKGPNVHNTKVVVVVPSGFSVSGCEKSGWRCEVAPASGGRTTVTYSREAGGSDTRFSFGVRTPGPGEYPFATNQTYSDNSTARWNGPPDSENPAPVLKVN